MRRVNVELLVGTHEVCQILGLSDGRVCQLVKGDPTFPEPVTRVRATPLWLAPEIEHWKITRVKKKAGRPSLRQKDVEDAVLKLLGKGGDGREDPGRKAD